VGQPIFTVNELNLPQDEFVAKFCGEPGTGRKGLFIWKDTKPFRVKSRVKCQASIIFCSISFQTMKNQKGKTFLKDKRYLSLLEFKRSVTTSLLLYGLNAEIGRKGDAPEARLMKEIPLSVEPGAKRRKDRLSVPDEIRFSQVEIHHPIFVENRGRCEWCQATTERRPNGHTKESRPFSQCSTVPTESLWKPERTLCKNAVFAVLSVLQFLNKCFQIWYVHSYK
jgi:hypothetical protein